MRFLLDACLPRKFADVLAEFGHVCDDVRDIGMGRADDLEIAAYGRANQLCILTEDWGFSDIKRYPPGDHFGIVVFETSDNSIGEKFSALRNLIQRAEVVESLPGRLAIVTVARIRLRPPL